MHALKPHLYIQLTWPIGLIIFVCIFVILIERKVYIIHAKSFLSIAAYKIFRVRKDQY
jgi:hypothetical protein